MSYRYQHHSYSSFVYCSEQFFYRNLPITTTSNQSWNKHELDKIGFSQRDISSGQGIHLQRPEASPAVHYNVNVQSSSFYEMQVKPPKKVWFVLPLAIVGCLIPITVIVLLLHLYSCRTTYPHHHHYRNDQSQKPSSTTKQFSNATYIPIHESLTMTDQPCNNNNNDNKTEINMDGEFTLNTEPDCLKKKDRFEPWSHDTIPSIRLGPPQYAIQ